mgnify:FL=1
MSQLCPTISFVNIANEGFGDIVNINFELKITPLFCLTDKHHHDHNNVYYKNEYTLRKLISQNKVELNRDKNKQK